MEKSGLAFDVMKIAILSKLQSAFSTMLKLNNFIISWFLKI